MIRKSEVNDIYAGAEDPGDQKWSLKESSVLQALGGNEDGENTD